MIVPSEFKCEFLSLNEIRDKADKFRIKHWPENTLPIEMGEIINRLQMDVIPEHKIKTDAYLQSDLTGIVVDFEQYIDEIKPFQMAEVAMDKKLFAEILSRIERL